MTLKISTIFYALFLEASMANSVRNSQAETTSSSEETTAGKILSFQQFLLFWFLNRPEAHRESVGYFFDFSRIVLSI